MRLGEAWAAAGLILAPLMGRVAADDGTFVPGLAASSAVQGLMTYYNDSGAWVSGSVEGGDASPWYQSGVALQAILDYTKRSGNRAYMDKAKNTIEQQKAPIPWWPQGGGDFRGDSTDDTGWWAMALTTMYELTNETSYLDMAKEDETYMYNYWNTSDCNGGILWSVKLMAYHNAISNELYLDIAATLANLVPSEKANYLTRAKEEWNWFANSGIINGDGLVNDGMSQDGKCTNNGGNEWTYNQGVILGALVQMYKATGDSVDYLTPAKRIADAVVGSATLSPSGILTEQCGNGNDCNVDGWLFKGIFMRNLRLLNDVIDNRPYNEYLLNNAKAAYTNARQAHDDGDLYSGKWQGPFDAATVASQTSAVLTLVAAMGL